MARADYQYSYLLELPDRTRGLRRFIRFQWTREGGEVVACCVQYELEIQGTRGHIKRFDDSSEDYGFHEHPLGWPECPSWPKTRIEGVQARDMLVHAKKEILAHADDWETEVLAGLVSGKQE